MRLRSFVAACALLLLTGIFSVAADEENQFKAKLTGFQETPSILTDGHGTFTLALSTSGTSISFTLTYTGLTGAALAAHIHFAQPGVAGAIIVPLCGGAKPAC